MKKMKLIGLFIAALLMNAVANGQVNAFKENNSSKDKKAEEIISLARKAVYKKDINPSKVKSIYLETAGELAVDSSVQAEGEKEPRKTKSRIETEENISIDLIDKVKQEIITRDAVNDPIGTFTKVTMISNGENVSFETEKIVDGKFFDLEESLKSSDIPEAVRKKIRAQQENIRRSLTRDKIVKSIVGKIMPVFLYSPWEDAPFVYVGKADAGNTKADILELTQVTGKKTRYFFDEKTHLLLMITEEIERADAAAKTSYFFSDYKLSGGMLIAGKINSETTSTVKQKVGEKTITSTSNIISEVSVKALKINQGFAANTFEINTKEK